MADLDLCAVDGCGKRRKSRQWCAMHTWRWKHHRDLNHTRAIIEPKLCAIDGCKNMRAKWRKELCNAHYLMRHRHGRTERIRAVAGDAEKWLMEHMTYEADGCLIWPFAKHTDGRGAVHLEISRQAHRAMCILVNGPPPSDIHEAAHSCGNGHLACVHPKHLRWATPLENTREKVAHGTQSYGEQVPSSKLKRGDVLQIRSLKGLFSQREIGLYFGVDGETIGNIHRGETWKWLK